MSRAGEVMVRADEVTVCRGEGGEVGICILEVRGPSDHGVQDFTDEVFPFFDGSGELALNVLRSWVGDEEVDLGVFRGKGYWDGEVCDARFWVHDCCCGIRCGVGVLQLLFRVRVSVWMWFVQPPLSPWRYHVVV